jgi:hypothetical protein
MMMLILQDPHFGCDIIGLDHHFILGKKYQLMFNIIFTWNYQLLVHITHNVTDKLCLISFHGWQEMLLAVLNHISSVMPIKVQAFLVVHVFKLFVVKLSLSSCQ